MKLSRRLFSAGLAAGTALGLAGLSADGASAWEPQKPVEFVVMAGQGGGADKLARFIQSIIEKNNFAAVPFIPINKGGGSGADALRYLKDNAGNPHIIMATLNSYYTTPLRNPGIGVNIEELTPVARLAEDTFLLWVNADSPIKTLEEYIAAAKTKGEGWKMAGTGTGQEDSLVTGMIENRFGLKMTYIPFKGGGDVAKQLVGGHADSTVNNPSEQMGFYQAGKARPIAAFTPERIPGFDDVPTMKELGHDGMTYFMQRSVVMPGGVGDDVRAYYEGVFRKVYDSPEWQDYCKKQALQCAWLSGNDLQSYFISSREEHRSMLKAAGEIQ
ncbi:MAG: tripartite tricarboxylate transporter substrate binding protein [Rhizobiales bacterium]|nr:tripartite tricarboxylate transporter substrate binding protein [Hyphomicrobiales bacterium]